MRTRNDSDDPKLARAVVETIVQIARCYYKTPLPEPITPERVEALRAINDHGPVGVSDLARVAKVRPASMSRMVSALVAEGLVSRKKDKVDKRAFPVALTVRGRKVLQSAREASIRLTAQALKQLSSEEIEVLRRFERRLRALQDDESR